MDPPRGPDDPTAVVAVVCPPRLLSIKYYFVCLGAQIDYDAGMCRMVLVS